MRDTPMTRTLFGYEIDTIYDDDGTTVIGYDVRAPYTTVDDQPIAEMRRTLAECRQFIHDDIRDRRAWALAQWEKD